MKMPKLKFTIIFSILISLSFNLNSQDYQGEYCDLEGATTDSGKDVTGECYMYSNQYGDLEGAETEDGESVSGECYRYSERYADLESAETESGESVSGECYFYSI